MTRTFKLQNLSRRVKRLRTKKQSLKRQQEKIKKESDEVSHCLLFLEGILKTHKSRDIPKYKSDESLFFFKDQSGESCLITELNPAEDFMPEMKRISIDTALTRQMNTYEGTGYVIERVLFAGEKGKHELMVLCPKRCLVEKL